MDRGADRGDRSARDPEVPQGVGCPPTRLGEGRHDPYGGFRAATYACRLYGLGVIEQSLASEVERAGARRAFVVCSPSITGRTSIVARITEALGSRYAGAFDGIEKDSTYTSVVAAKEAAVAAGADLLIAVGGGSVIVATRAVAIFMAVSASPFEIMTQYLVGKSA